MAKGWGWKALGLVGDLYEKGLMGGRPKRLLDLQEEAYKGVAAKDLAEAKEKTAASAALDQPTWEKKATYKPGREPSPLYDPAQGGALPPEVETPAEKGMSIRQLQELGKGLKDVPISELIQTKAGKGLVEPFMKLIFPEDVAEKAVGPGMYRSKEGIKAEEFEERAGEATPEYMPTLERLFGVREEVKAEVPAKAETKATSVKEYEAWKATDPANEKKSYGQFITWRASSLAQAKAKAIFGDLSKEKRLALDMAKVSMSQWIDSQPFGAVEMDQDQSLTMLMELYQDALTKVSTGKSPEKPEVGGRVEERFRRKEGERLDISSIQKAIDKQRAKKR